MYRYRSIASGQNKIIYTFHSVDVTRLHRFQRARTHTHAISTKAEESIKRSGNNNNAISSSSRRSILGSFCRMTHQPMIANRFIPFAETHLINGFDWPAAQNGQSQSVRIIYRKAPVRLNGRSGRGDGANAQTHYIRLSLNRTSTDSTANKPQKKSTRNGYMAKEKIV